MTEIKIDYSKNNYCSACKELFPKDKIRCSNVGCHQKLRLNPKWYKRKKK